MSPTQDGRKRKGERESTIVAWYYHPVLQSNFHRVWKRQKQSETLLGQNERESSDCSLSLVTVNYHVIARSSPSPRAGLELGEQICSHFKLDKGITRPWSWPDSAVSHLLKLWINSL